MKAEVYAKFVDTNSANWTHALGSLMSVISQGTSGIIADGTAYSTSTSSFPFTVAFGDGRGSGGPKAYLNWMVFDKNYTLITSKSGYARLSSAPSEHGQDVAHERLYSPNILITEPGYVYLYISNEETTPVEVYFDDFKVTHVKSPVIQTEDYYPFGLTFNSYQRENGVVNNYTYNGKERQDELDLGWLDYGARMYMPEIGRWGVVDPLADLSRRWSPFSYAYDNPLRFIDPDGMYSTEEWKKDHGITDDDVTNVYTAEKEPDQGGSDKPKVISREEWGARDANKNNSGYQEIEGSAKSYYNTIVVHHSGNADNDRSVNSVQDEHMDEDGYADIGYHFAIDLEGNIYEGRPINIKGEHVKGMNTGKIGIVLLTDLDTNNSGLNIAQKIAESIQGDGTETVPMVESLVKLVRYLRSEYGIEYLGGHHELLKERPCPGNVGLELVDKMRQAFKFNNPGGN